jgi:hypothetical protein
VIMQAHRALPGGILTWPSSIQVITPHNTPAAPPRSGGTHTTRPRVPDVLRR